MAAKKVGGRRTVKRGGKISKTAAKSYRRHRKTSHCHKKPVSRCDDIPSCMSVRSSARAKSYCRKTNNTRRRSAGGRRWGERRGGSSRVSRSDWRPAESGPGGGSCGRHTRGKNRGKKGGRWSDRARKDKNGGWGARHGERLPAGKTGGALRKLSPASMNDAYSGSKAKAGSYGDWGAIVPGRNGAAPIPSASPTGTTLAAMNAQGLSPGGDSALLDPDRSRWDVLQTPAMASKVGMGPTVAAMSA